MSSSWVVRLALPSQPLGLRLLVLTLSIGWLGAAGGSLFFLGYMASLPNAPGVPATVCLLIGTVLLLAAAGHAALVRAHRWTGVLFLLGACGVGVFLLYWTFWAALVLGLIYGD